MRGRCRSNGGSCPHGRAQPQRGLGVVSSKNLYGNAQVDEQIVGRLRFRDVPKRHDPAVVEPAGPSSSVIPDLLEDMDRSKTHQPGTSSSMVSSTTSAASPAVVSWESVASTSAPWARVPPAASSKCSRKS